MSNAAAPATEGPDRSDAGAAALDMTAMPQSMIRKSAKRLSDETMREQYSKAR